MDNHAVDIKSLNMEEPLIASAQLTRAALRRTPKAWAVTVRED